MANCYFQFRKFIIKQDQCAMKVGTDGVLLGAWVSVESCKTMLDVGTGTGLIALMLAQRSVASIDAIDIDPDACQQAEENVLASPYAGRICVYQRPFGEFLEAGKKYDLIVSNPPYFRHSLKSPDDKRTMARHAATLTFSDIIGQGKRYLNPNGRIALIIPHEQNRELSGCLHQYGLQLIRQTDVYPTVGGKVKRVLVELSADVSAPCSKDCLAIEEARHQYTEAYRSLTKDFYLPK